MSFTDQQLQMLNALLSRENVATRKGGGNMQLSYIHSHHAIREANRVFGFDGWSSETLDLRCIVDKPGSVSYSARVRITVYAGDRTIIRDGIGAGHGREQDVGQAHEKAVKEAESDAQKRALRQFGDQFGLALYDKEQANVTDAPATTTPPTTEAKPVMKTTKPTHIVQTEKPKATATAAPAQREPAEGWKDRERRTTSTAAAKKLIEGDQNGRGLLQMATDLAEGKPLAGIVADLEAWKARAAIQGRSITTKEDRDAVEKSHASLVKALNEEREARASEAAA